MPRFEPPPDPRPDNLTDLVVRLEEANRQERNYLHAEIDELRKALWCAIVAAGGEIRIDVTHRAMYRQGGCRIEAVDDKPNRTLILRAVVE